MEQVQLGTEEIKLALEHDSEFFIEFFLGQELIFPVPDFHKENFDLMVMQEVEKLALAIPRAHAKTTLAKLACIHYFLFSDFSYILYMSNTLSVSIPNVNDIIEMMETENFVSIFGHITVETRQEGKGFYLFTMPWGKKCILKAFGAGNQVRGTLIKKRRPQLFVVDDLEDNDNIATKELFLKLKRWVYGPFKKCADPLKNKWIWIGNMIEKQSMLYSHMQSDFWHSRLSGCLLENGKPLWQDMWSIEALKKDYKEYVENGVADVWFAEMMNTPMVSGNGIIDADEIYYLPEVQPRDFEVGFITLDLAITDKDWGHDSVIAVHIYNEDHSCFQIAETKSLHGADPVTLYPEVIKMGIKWNVGLVGIESVAYQASVKPVFEHFDLVYSVKGFEYVNVPARAQKTARIITWAGLIKAKEYALNEGDFAVTHQLLSYDPLKKENVDDIIDAGAHGVHMIRNYTHKIFAMARRLERGEHTDEVSTIRNSHDICRF